MTPHIWIDADSCPKLVRNYVVKYAKKLALPVTFAANKKIPAETDDFEMIVCGGGKDAADNYIAEHAAETDIVITRDIPFAGRLVEKQITVMNDRGTVFSKENIREKLSERDFDLQLARIGLAGCKANTYDKKQFALFANCFDKEIHRLIK